MQLATYPKSVNRLNTINWRLIDDHEAAELYWLEELYPTHTREVLHSEPSEAVKWYLKKEEEQCSQKLVNKRNASGHRLPPCPCISPDLRTCLIATGPPPSIIIVLVYCLHSAISSSSVMSFRRYLENFPFP